MSLPSDIEVILATDCGSTTTKAILIEKRSGAYRLVVRGEAPTTVEAPFEDVTRGVLNAVREVEEQSGRSILDGDRIVSPAAGDRGVDLYVSTSSAGGGLQMMVAGVVKSMTAESAERAALGAGAIVMETLASNDGRLPHERIERIRQLRPDMILLSGGVDGGTKSHVVEMAELISAADPRPRLGSGYDLPVIYAGNTEAGEDVRRILDDRTELSQVENLRPVLEAENLGPARERIHTLFMEHVMAQAPGYRDLMAWTHVPIMPTPGAVGRMVRVVADRDGIDVAGVDIGGATTDVFSVFGGAFNRTVSANLGMSYSISNVLTEAGLEAIARWLPFDITAADLKDRLGNKMIRPTSIPQTMEELIIEQAVAREALRLAFEQHRNFAVSLKGVQQLRTISDTFDQQTGGQTLVDLMNLDLIIGSGGVLSHAPNRSQAALMLMDAFQPEGITNLAVDSIFMMPHLGVLSTVHETAALEVFDRDCLVYLGPCVAPAGRGNAGSHSVTVKARADGVEAVCEAVVGELAAIPTGEAEEVVLEVTPSRGFDVGAGRGAPVTRTVRNGPLGVIIDTRGRPLQLPADAAERVEVLKRGYRALEVYPESS